MWGSFDLSLSALAHYSQRRCNDPIGSHELLELRIIDILGRRQKCAPVWFFVLAGIDLFQPFNFLPPEFDTIGKHCAT